MSPNAWPRPEWWRAAPPPGLHRDVPFQEYARWSAINNSILRHFSKTPAHARDVLLFPEESSEAQAFGQAVHKAILEPDLFESSYVASPHFDRRYKDQKAAWVAFQEANKGKEIITQDEWDTAMAMRDAVWAHPTARLLLQSPGANEVSAVWVDPEYKVACKGRQDRAGYYEGWPTIIDVKTTEDASRKAFSRSIEKYGYAEAAAMYLDGFEVLSHFQGDRRFMYIVPEKQRPFAVAVYELDLDAIALGQKRYREHLRQYAECLSSGVWGAYGDGADIISLPPWSFKGEDVA
jgi:hypothetical protein